MSRSVSVVMPAFQAERTVGAAVASVLWQTYPDVELVVVDDGSTDATPDIVAAHHGPIRLLRQENGGVASARNRGIREASGDLIAFCDADDLLLPGHIGALVAVHERQGGIAAANSYWLLPGGIHPSRMRYRGAFPAADAQRRQILAENFVSTMSLFPRSMVDEIGPLAEDLRRGEDWEFWIRAIFAGHRVALQRKPLALYRWGTTGLSAGRQEMDDAVREVMRRVAARGDLTAGERAYVARRLEGPGPRELARRGDQALRARRYLEAARSYRAAAALSPGERMLVWKARAISLAPPLAGPLIRARQLRIERGLEMDEGHTR